jgi:hypothetical protein
MFSQFLILYLLALIWCRSVSVADSTLKAIPSAQVFHFIIHYWGTLNWGFQPCDGISCEFFDDHLFDRLQMQYRNAASRRTTDTVTVSMYNIHYYHQALRSTRPNLCHLPTNLTLAESEESNVRFGFLFNNSFRHFDGEISYYILINEIY